jgi:hypothetical protein
MPVCPLRADDAGGLAFSDRGHYKEARSAAMQNFRTTTIRPTLSIFEAPMIDAVRREEKPLALTPYLVLGLLALVLALLVRAPASLLQKAVPAGAPFTVQAWGGTIWSGQALLHQGADDSFLTWRLHPLRLAAGRLAATVQVRGALGLGGELELGRGFWQLGGLQGSVPAALLQSLLPAGWQFQGSVQARGLVLARAGTVRGPWRAGGGQLQWGGGTLQYNLNGQTQTATLPAVVVNLRLDGDALMLSLNEAAGNRGLATVRLTPGGMAEVQLRERLLRYSPGYRSTGSDPDAIVVTARQPV